MPGCQHTIAGMGEVNVFFVQLRLLDQPMDRSIGGVLVKSEQALELFVGPDNLCDRFGLFLILGGPFLGDGWPSVMAGAGGTFGTATVKSGCERQDQPARQEGSRTGNRP
jgi:hypothetical protein